MSVLSVFQFSKQLSCLSWMLVKEVLLKYYYTLIFKYAWIYGDYDYFFLFSLFYLWLVGAKDTSIGSSVFLLCPQWLSVSLLSDMTLTFPTLDLSETSTLQGMLVCFSRKLSLEIINIRQEAYQCWISPYFEGLLFSGWSLMFYKD